MKRFLLSMIMATAIAGCSTANEPTNAPADGGHITRTRIDSWTGVLRDDDRGVTCYLWGTTGIFCLRDSQQVKP